MEYHCTLLKQYNRTTDVCRDMFAAIGQKGVSGSRWSAMTYSQNGTMPNSRSFGNSSPQQLSTAVGDSLRQTIAAVMKFPMGDVTL